MNDKIKINLQMAGSMYPLTILREDEEMIREAAKQVDIRISEYQKYYPDIAKEKIIVMAAYYFSLESLKQKSRNDTKPYASKVDELTDVLDAYFKEIKPSLANP